MPQAARLAEESAAIFRDLQAGPSLAEVLVTVARIRGAQGKAAAARVDLAEALALAGAAGPRVVVAAALEERAVQAVRAGEASQGVEFLGAAATLRQAIGAPVPLADQVVIDGARAAAHASLGDAAFRDAWAAGQACSVEHIDAHAMAGAENDIITC